MAILEQINNGGFIGDPSAEPVYESFEKTKNNFTTLNTEKLEDSNLDPLRTYITAVEGNVTTLQGDVTTVEGKVTTLQGDITTLQGDVTTVEGKVTTLQGDITTLQGEISNIEAGNIEVVITSQQIFDKTAPFFAPDTYINSTGTLIPFVSYNVIKLPLADGQDIFLTDFKTLSPFALCYFDANDNFLSSEFKTGIANTFQGVANCAYVLINLENVDIDIAIASYGTTSIPYEPYKEQIAKTEIQLATSYDPLNTDTPITGTGVSIAVSSVLDNVTNATGLNLVDKANPTANAFIGSAGTINSSGTSRVSNRIYFNGNTEITLTNAFTSTPYGVNYYDANDTLIETITQTSNLPFKYIFGASYILFSYAQANEDIVLANYGRFDIPYVAFQQKLNNQFLPISEVIPPRVVLPPKLYGRASADITRYYFDSLTERTTSSNISFDANSGQFQKLFTVTQATPLANKLVFLDLYENGLLVSKHASEFTAINTALVSGKTVNLMHIGNSFDGFDNTTDFVKAGLEADGVTVNQIGLMGVSDQRSTFFPGESPATALLAPLREARILTVTGVSVYPIANFITSQYSIAGVNYIVTGVDEPSSRIIIAPASGDTIPVEIPASGTMTRNAGTGDASINYTSFEVAKQNPFWNPVTSEPDFSAYVTEWNFNAPNILVLDFSYNSVGPTSTDADIEQAVKDVKIVVDIFLSQYPNAYVIYNPQPFGSLRGVPSLEPKGVKMLRLIDGLIKLFMFNPAYTQVIITTGYCNTNRLEDYNTTTVTPDPTYPSDTEIVASDPVHPNTNTGMQNVYRCLIPAIEHAIIEIGL